MHLAETAYDMPTGMLLHEAGRQFAMAEIVRDGWQQVLYERGGWFLLLVWAERTAGVRGLGDGAERRVEAFIEKRRQERNAGVEAVDSKTVPPSPAADPQKQPDSSYPAQPASQEVTAREAELTKLLWQAREALKTGEIRHVSDWEVTDVTPKIVRDAIAAINEALQEPTCAK